MTSLFEVKVPVIAMLCALFFVLACLQLLHALVGGRQAGRGRASAVACEFALVAHLALACLVATAAYSSNYVMVLRAGTALVPFEPLLWGNALCAALCLIAGWSGARGRSIAAAVLLAACTPPGIALCGPGAWALLAADAAFFAFRTADALCGDIRRFHAEPSWLSCVDALDRMPQGVAVFDVRGRFVFMNDAMRQILGELGLATDLEEATGLWNDLRDFALPDGQADARAAGGLDGTRGSLRVPVRGWTWLFTQEDLVAGRKPLRCICAVDISEEEGVNRQLERTNRLVEQANADLVASLADVQAAARADALVRMRQRVHDVIGQRLSILHRLLEDGGSNPQAFARARELVGGIAGELAESSLPDSATELASVVDAFTVAGCAVEVEGALPEDPAVARACVRIVREAATNAMRHGRARQVRVDIVREDGAVVLSVSDDGNGAREDIMEGTGLAGMRQAAQAAGGSFAVVRGVPFTVEARFPRER